ncbi:CRAL_TRIO domain-containing protein/CRAL_TRIO_N domain-containing protein [Cephalotus follicularis]|uniref:CRAL_TRIO domain-containing protein/CRAL_TRIO_N domain-containing protein n=1 Tax=Cephalotus follicularis TaxID=3775 RepID=A0A1Q3CNL4_CEPFO|nr:CRAL_TRIO domain-containing protein/CRAL_TRIO_N domain-containing protein [Cephalotus follicularis]
MNGEYMEQTKIEEKEARSATDSMKINEREQTQIGLMRAYVETRDPSSKTKIEEKEARRARDSMKINEREQTQIGLMRAYVETQDPSSKEVDDQTLRRFLHARDLDIEKASVMFLKYLNWRRTYVVNGSISPSEVPHEIEQNKFFLQGSDKNGRPVAVLLASRHFKHKGGLDEFKRFNVYLLDKICSRMPSGQEKFVLIADLEGWGYSNSDIRAYLAALSLVQEYYPERLGKMFIVHSPYIFMSVWKILHPFIDNKTRKKIIFVDNKKLESTLLEEIDESQLPQIYGGQLPLVPAQDA